MGGRPPGSKNKIKESWRHAEKLTKKIGTLFGKVLQHLSAQPMNMSDETRLQRVIARRMKNLRDRSRHARPVITQRGLEIVYSDRTVRSADRPKVARSEGNGAGGGLNNVSEGIPDAGARRAAAEAKRLERYFKKFVTDLSGEGRLTGLSTRDGLQLLDTLGRLEKFYLEGAKDPRPIIKALPALQIILSKPYGYDPLAVDHQDTNKSTKDSRRRPTASKKTEIPKDSSPTWFDNGEEHVIL